MDQTNSGEPPGTDEAAAPEPDPLPPSAADTGEFSPEGPGPDEHLTSADIPPMPAWFSEATRPLPEAPAPPAIPPPHEAPDPIAVDATPPSPWDALRPPVQPSVVDSPAIADFPPPPPPIDTLPTDPTLEGGGWVAPLPPPGDVWRPADGLAPHAVPVTPPGVAPQAAAGPIEAPRPRQRLWPVVVVALLAGFVGTLLAVGGLFALGFIDNEPPETIVAPVVTSPPVTVIERIQTQLVDTGSTEGVAKAVGEKVIPSIVTVFTSNAGAETGSGSGVVMSEDGYIISNDHVVADSDSWAIAFNDGRRYEASLVGSDPLTDLAVLRIDATDLPAIEFGATEVLSIGDTAIAVGSPLGLDGGPSLTVGVVSAFNRSVGVGADPGDRLYGMIQTDAPITLGSSGGALVDSAGRLIGITTAIGVSSAGAEGIGFATPVEVVKRVVDEIIEIGAVNHAFLGVGLSDHTIEDDLGFTIPGGGLVSQIVGDESAAAIAGIETGDVIVRFDGTVVLTSQDLIVGLRRYRVGDVVEFEVVRGEETIILQVELGQRPDDI